MPPRQAAQRSLEPLPVSVVQVDGAWKILGRSSVDIIKHGGYKLSALEIENHLLEHPDIAEVAVCGVADEAYGEHVGAVVVLAPGAPNLDVAALRSWAKEFIAEYKVILATQIVFALACAALEGVVIWDRVLDVFQIR